MSEVTPIIGELESQAPTPTFLLFGWGIRFACNVPHRRGRQGARPGLRGGGDPSAAGLAGHFHRAQDFLRRGSGANLPLHLAAGEKVDVVSKGRVRRARLYYLRERTGKAARIRRRLAPARAAARVRQADQAAG